ncbi:hypothetical protein ACOSQ3_032296 [Xanthoceras sorbifolium]
MLLEIKDIGRGSEEIEDLQMEEEVVEIKEEVEDDITTMVTDQLAKFVEKEAIQQCFATTGLTGHMSKTIRIIPLIILSVIYNYSINNSNTFQSHPMSINEVVRHIFKEEMHLNFNHM